MPRLSTLLLAAVLAFPCLAAYGQEGDPAFQCFPAKDVEAGIEAQRGRGINVQVLEGEVAGRFVASLNAMEPVTDYKADKIVIMILDEIGAFALINGETACAFRQPVPAELLKMWIKKAQGISA
jgi:hypothetical protein